MIGSYVMFLYRNGLGFQGKNTVVVSTSGSSERFWLSLDVSIFKSLFSCSFYWFCTPSSFFYSIWIYLGL